MEQILNANFQYTCNNEWISKNYFNQNDLLSSDEDSQTDSDYDCK